MEFNIALPGATQLTSARAKQVMTDFDLKPEHTQEFFSGNIDIDGRDWHIGAIVGGSGTGKSTIAREVFGDNYIRGYQYHADAVLDDMPEGVSVDEIERVFSSVGFASPPCWLKPYAVLSTGEKMRVDLARAILSDREMVVFDEFTSVVDRQTAKTASLAIQKAIRRRDGKFVAVACHKDILEWLQPDWVYDTDAKSFFGLRGATNTPEYELTYTDLLTGIKNGCGTFLGSITI